MNLKKNISTNLLTPFKVSIVFIFFFAIATSWQYTQIVRKNSKISTLLAENESLKKTLLSIDGELAEIKDAASDVRVFQKEIVKVIKDIDPKYATTFASRNNTKTNFGFSDSVTFDPHEVLKNTQESIFFLSNSQEKLRYDTASFLGQTLSIKSAMQSIPSMIPIKNATITSQFGPRIHPTTGQFKHHWGLDFAAAVGTPVYAAADGIVKRANFDSKFGNVVELIHDSGYQTTYGHLSEILTKRNAKVKRGDQIGFSGATGSLCSGAHLHYEVSQNGVKKNPNSFLWTKPPSFF